MSLFRTFRGLAAALLLAACAPSFGPPLTSVVTPSVGDDVIIARDGTRLIANGGRVLNVCGHGENIAQARGAAYGAIAMIDWPALPSTILRWLSRSTKIVCSMRSAPSRSSFHTSVSTVS